MKTDWSRATCGTCEGSGWIPYRDDDIQCGKCGGHGKLMAPSKTRNSTMNSDKVLQYVIDNWSLIGGGALAGLSAFQASGSLRTALMAVGAYLLGHASVKSPQINTLKARFAKRAS